MAQETRLRMAVTGPSGGHRRPAGDHLPHGQQSRTDRQPTWNSLKKSSNPAPLRESILGRHFRQNRAARVQGRGRALRPWATCPPGPAEVELVIQARARPVHQRPPTRPPTAAFEGARSRTRPPCRGQSSTGHGDRKANEPPGGRQDGDLHHPRESNQGTAAATQVQVKRDRAEELKVTGVRERAPQQEGKTSLAPLDALLRRRRGLGR